LDERARRRDGDRPGIRSAHHRPTGDGRELRGYHLLPATRGELLLRLGRHDEARAEFATAARLAGNERERALLELKARPS
jgi:predicted RNA polymerase sigma factor